MSDIIDGYLPACAVEARWPHGTLDHGSTGLGLRPCQGHCVVFFGKVLDSHSASLHPGVFGYRRI